MVVLFVVLWLCYCVGVVSVVLFLVGVGCVVFSGVGCVVIIITHYLVSCYPRDYGRSDNPRHATTECVECVYDEDVNLDQIYIISIAISTMLCCDVVFGCFLLV